MSKGIGKIQRVIFDLLSGKRTGQVYRSASVLDTRELLDELLEAGFVSDDMPRKQQMNTVLRACAGLSRRNLIVGKYVTDSNNAGRTTVSWSEWKQPIPSISPSR